MEQFIQLIKYDSGKDLIEMLEELWVVYKIISARRYIASRGISAGRHIRRAFGCSEGIWLFGEYLVVRRLFGCSGGIWLFDRYFAVR